MKRFMQLQRFVVAVSKYGNCQVRPNVVVALFRQLLDNGEPVKVAGSSSYYYNIMIRLRPSLEIQSNQLVQVNATFRYPSGLLVFNDIIASTILLEPPKLFDYHWGLLDNTEGSNPPSILRMW